MKSRQKISRRSRQGRSLRFTSAIALAGVASGAAGAMAALGADTPAGASNRGSLTSSVPGPSFKHPHLKGDKIVFADGSQQDVSDAELYVLTKILGSWGANASIINVTSDSVAVTEVLSGAANVGYIGTNGTIDSNLVSFAPALPHVDYQLVTAPKFKTIKSLVGKGIFSYSKPSGLEGEMWLIALKYAKLGLHSIEAITTGGQSTRVAALLSGRIQAAMLDSVHYQELLRTPGGSGFNDALNMAVVAPQLADSTLSANGGWLSHHPQLAIAVDEAWLAAAKLFQTEPKIWIKDAYTYSNESGGANETLADATLQYHIYKADQEFLDQSSVFSPAHARYNEVIANGVGALPNGAPPLSRWFSSAYWKRAIKGYGVS